MKKVFFLIILFLSVFLCSCKNELRIKLSDSGISFVYSASCGKAFVETIQSLNGEYEGDIFSKEDVASLFETAGFKNLQVEILGKDSFQVQGNFAEDKTDAFSMAEILLVGKDYLKISISPEKLRQLYSNLPDDLRAYIDMFMSPTFTGEEMTNDEYIGLIETVYGTQLAQELKDSQIVLYLEIEKKSVKKFSISLVNFLNMIGTLVFENGN